MKTQDIERVIANKIADYWYHEIHGKIAPIFGKQKLRDFAESELKKLHIPRVLWRSGQFCPGTMSPLDDPADGGVCDVGLHISNIDGETRKFYNGNYEILLPAGKDATISIILTDDAIDYILDQLNFAKSKN